MAAVWVPGRGETCHTVQSHQLLCPHLHLLAGFTTASTHTFLISINGWHINGWHRSTQLEVCIQTDQSITTCSCGHANLHVLSLSGSIYSCVRSNSIHVDMHQSHSFSNIDSWTQIRKRTQQHHRWTHKYLSQQQHRQLPEKNQRTVGLHEALMLLAILSLSVVL